MSTILEEEWKTALFQIVKQLDEPQYKTMMLFLSEIPKSVKTTESREQMPQVIIEHFGEETSVHKINEIMDRIPRRDAAVQDRLRPFVERLKKKQEDERRGKKRKQSETVLRSADRKDGAGEQKSCQPDKVGEKSSSSALNHSLSQTDPGTAEKSKKKKKMENKDASKTHKVPTISETNWKRALTAILGQLNNPQYNEMLTFLKILQKKKTTKFKEHLPQKIIERFGVETSIRKVKEALDQIPRRDDAVQKHLRPFVDKLKSKQEKKKKGKRINSQRKTDPVGIMKSKKKKTENKDSSLRSAETTETPKTDPVGTMKPKKKKTQNNDLSMKSAETTNTPKSDCSEPSKAKLEEPVNSDSSLNLNGATKTPKVAVQVQSAPVHTGRVKIKAVTAFNKSNTHLVVNVKTQLKECFVRTRLLAEALGYKMDEGVEARIREAMPISAEAEMQGKKITAIKKV
ncbi:uncharacterized protein LOC116333499 [Oreochromis aureus]|uniref:uncharacterized protein LOC116333499 n=1 Tax=Oreochromis aureus TaxID=47969 RepID=UPI001953BB63|nr:uncharacterized protein LOC116333499 [Oreochromis aureus]XP_039474895.1 uncharacterized protein LOC116333499 [Oreochromis aureus]